MQTEISKVSLEEIEAQTLNIQNRTAGLIIQRSEDLDTAKVIEKECTSLEKFIEAERKRYTDPLNEVVKKLIQKEKDLMAPITQAKEDIRAKQIAFAQKQEKERLEKENEILVIIQKINTTPDDIELELLMDTIITKNETRIQLAYETRIQFFAEQERLAEFARQQAIEQERLKKIQKEWGIEAARIEKEKAEDRLRKQAMEDENKRILEDGKRQEMKELADSELKRANASYATPKGMRKVVNFEVIDETLVPRACCTSDMSKIKAAYKLGQTEIPGVRIWEEDKIQ